MEKEKKYDNNMRGALFRADRKNDRAPIASGTLTVAGANAAPSRSCARC